MRRLTLLVVMTAAVVALVVTVRPHHKTPQRPPAAIASASTSSSTTAGSAFCDTAGLPIRHRNRSRPHRLRRRPGAGNGGWRPHHGNPIDVELSKPAARTLEREVLHAQSAKVDVVTGATYTSVGYLKSLQAALDKLSVSTSQAPRVIDTAPPAVATTAS